jgi:acyl carrier protein phosphodiesterase
MDTEMTLEQPQLEQIGRYVKTHIAEWILEIPTRYSRDFEIELRERTVRVEEELKSQRELIMQILNQMDKRFEQTDKHFEQVDRHFEQVDKRFEQIYKRFDLIDKRFGDINKRFTMLMWAIGTGFTLITVTFLMVAAFLKH